MLSWDHRLKTLRDFNVVSFGMKSCVKWHDAFNLNEAFRCLLKHQRLKNRYGFLSVKLQYCSGLPDGRESVVDWFPRVSFGRKLLKAQKLFGGKFLETQSFALPTLPTTQGFVCTWEWLPTFPSVFPKQDCCQAGSSLAMNLNVSPACFVGFGWLNTKA